MTKPDQHIHLIVGYELYERLVAEKKRTGTPLVELARRALDKSLPRLPKKSSSPQHRGP